MQSLYIISTKDLAEKNVYKIGIHKGTKKALLSRYRTYLINPIIFYYMESDESWLIERKLLLVFNNDLITNNNNRKSEWIKIELNYIIDFIEDRDYNYYLNIIISFFVLFPFLFLLFSFN